VVIVAAVALTIYFLLPEDPTSRAVVEDVAGLHTRDNELGRPEAHSDVLLKARHESVPFPAFDGRFGWEAVGKRDDVVRGRAATTVFYEHKLRGARMGYTVLSGRALAPIAGGRRTRVAGTRLRTIESDGRQVVTWVRLGHTCVMSAADVPAAELRRLAAWKGGGGVPF
jgi:hypothetical protein